MKPSRHFIVSLSIGAAIWFFAKSLYAGLACLVSGVLLDFDHIIEYMVHFGWRNFNYKRCCLACEQTRKQEGVNRFGKVYLIFHGAEIALGLWFLTFYTKNVYFFAGALGYTAHLILDYIANPVYPFSYFIVWRAVNKFNADRFLRKRVIQKKIERD